MSPNLRRRRHNGLAGNNDSPDQAGLSSIPALEPTHVPDRRFLLSRCVSYCVSQRSNNATAERKS